MPEKKYYSYDEVFKKDKEFHIDFCYQQNHVKHYHEFMELIYIVKGKGIHYIEGREYDVERGCLLLVNYNQSHSFKSDGMHIYNILIKPDLFSSELVNTDNAFELLSVTSFADFPLIPSQKRTMVHFSGEEMLLIESLLQGVYKEYSASLRGRNSIIKLYITLILSYIFRKMSTGCLNEFEYDKKIPSKILEYIEAHYNEKITLKQMAEKCMYNPSYFSKIFRECYGMSMSEYIQKKRIEYGKKLLVETNLPVDQIGAMVGYDDHVRFYRYFKKIYGITPRQYRFQMSKSSKNNNEQQ